MCVYVCVQCVYACTCVRLFVRAGERPYHCGACGQRYTQGHLLKAHIRSRHGADMQFYNMDKRTDGVRCRRSLGLKMENGAGGVGSGVSGLLGAGKEDKIRFLLQAAEASRQQQHQQQQQQLSSSSAGLGQFMSPALSQYMTALSSCLPGGMRPMLWPPPPPPPLSLIGPGAAGNRFPPEGLTSHAALLSSLAAAPLPLTKKSDQFVGGMMDLPRSMSNSILSSMLTSLPNGCGGIVSSMTMKNGAGVLPAPDAMKFPLIVPDVHGQSRMESAADGGMDLTTSRRWSSAAQEGGKSESRFQQPSPPGDFSKSFLLDASFRPGGGAITPSSAGFFLNPAQSSAVSMASPMHKSGRSTPSPNHISRSSPMHISANLPSPLHIREGEFAATDLSSSRGGDAWSHSNGHGAVASPAATDLSSRWEEAPTSYRLDDVADLSHRGEDAADLSSASKYRSTLIPERSFCAASGVSVKEEPRQQVGRDREMDDRTLENAVAGTTLSSEHSCAEPSCPYLKKLKDLRRNVYRMLSVFTPYLGIADVQDCEADTIDEFLHEVIYSKLDDGDQYA